MAAAGEENARPGHESGLLLAGGLLPTLAQFSKALLKKEALFLGLDRLSRNGGECSLGRWREISLGRERERRRSEPHARPTHAPLHHAGSIT